MEPWDSSASRGRPCVTLSYAQTLDGRLATATGSSRWISGPESLRFTHALRATHDAIMVGAGTVVRDDPRLTVRLVPGRDPWRVIVDSTLRISPLASVLAHGAATGTIIAVTGRAAEERVAQIEGLGATVLRLPEARGGGVDLATLLRVLGQRGIGSVMVEGGARLITAMLRARLADRAAITLAPKILGAGVEAVGDLGLDDLARAVRLADAQFTPYGVDVVVEGRLVYPEATDARSDW